MLGDSVMVLLLNVKMRDVIASRTCDANVTCHLSVEVSTFQISSKEALLNEII